MKFNEGNIFRKTDKRAALTTQQIVILIILITSFLIIMFFLFRLNLQKTTDKEVCHNSVVLRANSIVPSKTIPLNCKTSYVCITKDGSCENMPYYTYRTVVKNKKEMYDALAEEMADCWWMFGEGKINYAGEETIPDLYCSVCSQFNFDNSVNEIFPKGFIDKNDFYMNYLAETKIPGKQMTYAEYLFGTNNLQEILKSLNATGFGKINFSDANILLMGITSKVSALGWIIKGVAAAAGVLFMPFVSIGVLSIGGIIVLTTGGGAGALTALIVKGVSGKEFIAPTIISWKDYNEIKCEHIVTKG